VRPLAARLSPPPSPPRWQCLSHGALSHCRWPTPATSIGLQRLHLHLGLAFYKMPMLAVFLFTRPESSSPGLKIPFVSQLYLSQPTSTTSQRKQPHPWESWHGLPRLVIGSNPCGKARHGHIGAANLTKKLSVLSSAPLVLRKAGQGKAAS
jgi:hypothetical protein